MKRVRDEEPLSPRDAELVASMRRGFSPEPLDPVGAAGFDARLRERIERGERRTRTWAALAAVGAAAVAWLALPVDLPPVEPASVPSAATLAWEEEVVFGDGLGDPLAIEDRDLLPPDYLALASAFDF
jgi:hypothetical protein